MYAQAQSDSKVTSRLSQLILSRLAIGAGRLSSSPQVVLTRNDEFRDELREELTGKIAKAQGLLVSEINTRISLVEKPGLEQGNADSPSRAEAMRLRNVAIPTKAYSGIAPNGDVKVWADGETIPAGAAILFTANQSGTGWSISPLENPDLSTPYFSAIKNADSQCSLAERNAAAAVSALAPLEPRTGFDLSALDQKTKVNVEGLSEGERLGTVPAVLVNYANGEMLPLELYVSKRKSAAVDEAGIFVLAKSGKKEDVYCVVDPLTKLYAEGKTFSEAFDKLSKCGFYPPGALFCQSASNGFTSKFEKAGVIGASTVDKGWADKADAIAGGMGWFSMGCMMAAPESGGITGAIGTATGVPAMGWFGVRAIQHFVQKWEHKKELFDPTKPEDWREAGVLLTSILSRGKAGTVARITGLGVMSAADVWEFADQYSELKKDKAALFDFFLKRGGQLAASLAMNLYFSGKEVRDWKAVKLSKTETAGERSNTEKKAQDDAELGQKAVPTSLAMRGEELAGAKRLLLELENDPVRAMALERQYTDLVSGIARRLGDLGITPKDEERFIKESWDLIANELKMKFVDAPRLLHQALSDNQWQCDLVSTLLFDVAREMGMHCAVAMVPSHAFVVTSNFYFDPTFNEYGPIIALRKKYPFIEKVTSDPRIVQSLTYQKLGFEAELAGDFEKALRHLGKALELNPRAADAYNNRGIVHGKMGNYDRAIADFDKALGLNPSDVAALANRKKALAERDIAGGTAGEQHSLNPELQAKKDRTLSEILSSQEESRDPKVKAIARSEITSALDDLQVFSDRGGKPEQLLSSFSGYFSKEFPTFPSFVSYIVKASIPGEILPKFPEIRAELSRINGKPYDFMEKPLLRLEGKNPVFRATMDDGRSIILKLADCREDVFSVELLRISGIQQTYGVVNHNGFSIIEPVRGSKLESIFESGNVFTEKGMVGLTPETRTSISYGMGKQMAAHYVFSIPDWHAGNFIVMFEKGQANVSRIDFEQFSTRGPNERRFKLVYPENWFDQAQFEKGFIDGFKSIQGNREAITSYYRDHFQIVTASQRDARLIDFVSPSAALTGISAKMQMSPQEALRGFKSEQ